MGARKKTARKATARKTAARKNARRKTAARRKSAARKRLAPAERPRGLAAGEVALALDAPEIRELVREVEDKGGAAIGAYREPLSGNALLLAVVPIAKVQPTPFQRDLSPTHARRLSEKIDLSGSFLDPLIVVRGEDGQLWTPNGRHRLAAAKVLGLRQITILVSPHEELAYKILALNTEKAHNLRDKSREVIRMARAIAARRKRVREIDFEAEFESPAHLTLGLAYEENGRFAGSAYHPVLRKVDRFSGKTLAASLREREGLAAKLLDLDAQVAEIVSALKARGFRSPYLKTFVVARINPVRFHRAKKGDSAPPMTLAAALVRMAAAARKLDPASVKQSELALVAAVAPEEDD